MQPEECVLARRWRPAYALLIALLIVSGSARAQSRPAGATPATRPATTQPARTEAVKRVAEWLAKPVTINFSDTPFEDVLDFMTDLTGVSIVVHQKAIIAEGITPETTITLKVSKVRLDKALSLTLGQVGLQYLIADNGRIAISNAAGMAEAKAIAEERRLLVPASRPATLPARRETAGMKQVRELFEKSVSVEFPGTKFENVIDFLMDINGVTIIVDPLAGARKGIRSDIMVKLKVTNVPMKEVFRRILEPYHLEYVITQTCVLITDKEGLPTAEAMARWLK